MQRRRAVSFPEQVGEPAVRKTRFGVIFRFHRAKKTESCCNYLRARQRAILPHPLIVQIYNASLLSDLGSKLIVLGLGSSDAACCCSDTREYASDWASASRIDRQPYRATRTTPIIFGPNKGIFIPH